MGFLKDCKEPKLISLSIDAGFPSVSSFRSARVLLVDAVSSMISALAIILRPIHVVKSSIAPSHTSPNTGENAVETWPPIEHGRER